MELMKSGRALNYQGRFADAVNVLGDALTLLRQTSAAAPSDVADVLVLRSYALCGADRVGQGLDDVREAIALYESSPQVDGKKTGWAYYTLSSVYDRKGVYDLAIDASQKAVHLLERALGPGHRDLAKIHCGIGVDHYYRTEYGKAVPALMRGLAILQHHDAVATVDGLYHFMMLSSVNLELGELDSAVWYGRKGLEILETLPDAPSGFYLSFYGGLGNAYRLAGDVANAKVYLYRALDHVEKDDRSEPSVRGGLWRDLALVHMRAGEMELASQYSQRSIAEFLKVRTPAHPQMGYSYRLAGEIDAARGRYDSAVLSFRKAVEARETVGDGGYRSDVAVLRTLAGEALLRAGRNEEAEREFDAARNGLMADAAAGPSERAEVLYRIGEFHRALGRTDSALTAYHHAMQALLRISPDTDVMTLPEGVVSVPTPLMLQAVSRSASLLAAKRTVPAMLAAAVRYDAAMDLADALRRSYAAEGSKLLLAGEVNGIFTAASRNALRLAATTGRARYRERAFLIADRGKANILAERLAEAGARHFAGVPDDLIEQEKRYQREAAAIEIRLHTGEGRGLSEGERRSLNDRLFVLHEEQQRLTERLHRDYPSFHALRVPPRPGEVSLIQRTLPPEGALVEYTVHGDELLIFTLTRTALHADVVPNAGRIEKAAERFTSAIRRYEAEDFRASAGTLTASLLSPVLPHLRGVTSLIIVPDGFLHALPFEAVPVAALPREGSAAAAVPYLITRYAVSYNHSATLQAGLDGAAHGTHPDALDFAGFAPVFRDSVGNGDFLAQRSAVKASGLSDVRSITLDGRRFAELPYSEEEIGAVTRAFNGKGKSGRSFLHTEATEEAFKRNAGGARILHVATHGFINERQPGLSAILFSQNTGGGEDGILHARETYGLDLDADLVVLSSCESGVGTIVQGEGAMALMRGLFYAGAQNVMYSLWKVSDRHTSRLMERFYEGVLDGRPYADALRRAKLSMIADPETASPGKWSGFVLTGR